MRVKKSYKIIFAGAALMVIFCLFIANQYNKFQKSGNMLEVKSSIASISMQQLKDKLEDTDIINQALVKDIRFTNKELKKKDSVLEVRESEFKNDKIKRDDKIATLEKKIKNRDRKIDSLQRVVTRFSTKSKLSE